MLGLLISKRQDKGDPNYVALLSLKLLLLAFFIMLNAMSSFEEDKARAVLDSVNSTFNGDASQLERFANFNQSLDDLDDKAELVSEIERLFETTIPAVERDKGSTQSFLRLRLPVEAMFLGNEIELASGRELLLKRIVQSLGAYTEKGGYYEFEFLYGVPSRNSKARAAALEIALKRSEIVAQEILMAGMPEDRFAIGLQPNQPKTVFIVIRIYDSPTQNITFESIQEQE